MTIQFDEAAEREVIHAEMKSFIDAKTQQGSGPINIYLVGASDEEVAEILRMFPGANAIR